ncbi:MAG: hypothetical protein ACLGHN_06430 [Bacteriovoracia bacterium]
MKKKSAPEATRVEAPSVFDEGIPSELVPKDLSLYSSREKLEGDLDYREQKFETLVKREVEEFVKIKDRYGKDEIEYQKLILKHDKAREEFRRLRNELRQKYHAERKDQDSEDIGLR